MPHGYSRFTIPLNDLGPKTQGGPDAGSTLANS